MVKSKEKSKDDIEQMSIIEEDTPRSYEISPTGTRDVSWFLVFNMY